MKNYLNKHEKNQVLTIASFVSFFNDLADEWEKLDRDSKPIGNMRRARTRAQRVLDYLFEEIDGEQKKKMVEQLSKMELVARYKDQAAREYKKMQKLEDVTPVDTDDLFDIANTALNYCIKKCTNTGKEVENCVNRKLFLKYDIPVLDDKAKAGKCPYQFKSLNKIREENQKTDLMIKEITGKTDLDKKEAKRLLKRLNSISEVNGKIKEV